MTDRKLPLPDSEELRALLTREDLRTLYAYLYMRRHDPPTMVEIREYAATKQGTSHSQTDRRVRELRGWFRIPATRVNKVYVYRLEGFAGAWHGMRSPISPKIRGEVLAAKRCAQCGKTPAGDHVKLEIDHKIPHSWGGTDAIDNLQPLCMQCNHDKQAFFASLDPYEEQIRAASAHTEPHRRIGELLKAFRAAGVEVPAQVVAVVASMHQYQDDWPKRMRELRILGWDYTTTKKKRNGRMMSYYRLTRFTDWPEGNISAEISRREKSRKSPS